MKSITILLAALTISFLPATLHAQSSFCAGAQNEPVNYYAEFADLMHGEMDAKTAPVAAPSARRFPAFVHYREVTQGKAEDFPAYYEKIAAPGVPPAKAVFAHWTAGKDCPHAAMTNGGMTFKASSTEDCSGR
jgi:hypothetical protein